MPLEVRSLRKGHLNSPSAGLVVSEMTFQVCLKISNVEVLLWERGNGEVFVQRRTGMPSRSPGVTSQWPSCGTQALFTVVQE